MKQNVGKKDEEEVAKLKKKKRKDKAITEIKMNYNRTMDNRQRKEKLEKILKFFQKLKRFREKKQIIEIIKR